MIPEMPEPPKPIDVWWVLPDSEVEQLTVADGKEQACIWGVLYGMRADHGSRYYVFDDTPLRVVEFGTPQGAFAVQEPSMKCFMHVMRANGIHGVYRKAGDQEKTYEF